MARVTVIPHNVREKILRSFLAHNHGQIVTAKNLENYIRRKHPTNFTKIEVEAPKGVAHYCNAMLATAVRNDWVERIDYGKYRSLYHVESLAEFLEAEETTVTLPEPKVVPLAKPQAQEPIKTNSIDDAIATLKSAIDQADELLSVLEYQKKYIGDLEARLEIIKEATAI